GKSPLTGAIASGEAGGWWGHEFKRTGFDALVIRGQAKTPVYLWIHNQQVEIRPADHLWGMLTAPTESAIRQELGDQKVRVAQIGPSGENRVLYAAVMHDINRAAGRAGLGALMGSKNLKAVAVRGTQNVPVGKRAEVTGVAKWLGANYKQLMAGFVKDMGRGTQDNYMGLSYVGGLPTKNFGEPIYDHPENMSGERNYEMYYKDRDTCQACPVWCKQVFENEDEDPNRRLDPVYGGAEYEGMGALGAYCGVEEDNLAVLKANELCNAYGLDAISTGCAIAFAMECFENGIITTQDTGGLDYSWGNTNTLLKSVEMITRREGFGNILADGVYRMHLRFGPESEPFDITVKGLEMAMHEPRLKFGLGLGYAVAPVGADHMMNIHDTAYTSEGRALNRINSIRPEGEKIGPVPATDLGENKVQIFVQDVNWNHFQDCAVTCRFYPYDYQQLATALSGATGVEFTAQDVLDVGARAQTLSRLFNLREGFTAEDDKLPKRVMKAFTRGPLAGNEITDEALAWAKRRYYELMNWDPETAVPTAACLQALALDKLPAFEALETTGP
ncbi:MAG: aldehyde ferredoxin oxidoreductase, partial [Chloroflexi bacterium]